MVPFCKKIEAQPWFHFGVMAVIILNAAVLGLETVKEIHDPNPLLFDVLHWAFQIIFTAEIAVRFFAARSPAAFFADGWNLFDFLVVAVGWTPETGSWATIARLARVLRVARLVEIVPDMKLIVGTMLRSMRSMSYVILMILFLLYTYAIVGYHLFQKVDDKNWGSLGKSMWSLFQTMTLEGWVDKQKDLDVPGTVAFYASFLIIATYVVVNLFVAVVVNNLQEIKAEYQEAKDQAHSQHDLLRQVEDLRTQLAKFENTVRGLK